MAGDSSAQSITTTAPTEPSRVGAAGWLGLIVWTLVAILLVLIEIFLLPFTVGNGFHIPISVLLVLVGNSLIPRVIVQGTGVRWAWVVPAAIWVLVVFPASMVTSDGDALIPGKTYSATWNIIYLGVGAASALFGAVLARTDFTAWREYRAISGSRR